MSNYRCLKTADVTLNPDLNIIVGNNECGKSTLLEAVHLALSGQLNGRPIQIELHPHLFNAETVTDYIAALIAKTARRPTRDYDRALFPRRCTALAKLKGINNTVRADLPGVGALDRVQSGICRGVQDLRRGPDAHPHPPDRILCRRNGGASQTTRLPREPSPSSRAFIDASTIRNNAAASRYVVDIMRDSLSKGQKVDLALSYRMMKDAFMDNAKVKGVNEALAKKKGDISDKALSVSLDTSSRASWETGVMPHLDDVPLTLVGKGEQNPSRSSSRWSPRPTSHLILIEEAENHLSFSNLNVLISHIAESARCPAARDHYAQQLRAQQARRGVRDPVQSRIVDHAQGANERDARLFHAPSRP